MLAIFQLPAEPRFFDAFVISIPLTHGKFAVVDDSDYSHLTEWCWYAKPHGNTFYAARKDYGRERPFTIYMHRQILSVESGILIDHRDRNGLNNCRDNLRIGSFSGNSRNAGMFSTNTSGFKGVSWVPASSKWYAYIKVNGKKFHLGYFDDIQEASDVRDSACLKYHGEYAFLNSERKE